MSGTRLLGFEFPNESVETTHRGERLASDRVVRYRDFEPLFYCFENQDDGHRVKLRYAAKKWGVRGEGRPPPIELQHMVEELG